MSGTPKSLYRDEGVVLRTQKLGEADRIITVLTRRHGKVRAVAKGVRRTKSKFGSRLEPFSHVDLQLYTGRNLDIVSQAESIRSYGNDVVDDYPCYTAGTAVLETADRLTSEEKEPSLRLFLLVIGAMRSLADRTHPAGLVLDAFLLRSLSVNGYAPSFDACARCGVEGPHVAFNPSAGGMLCSGCRLPGSARPAEETVEVLAALLSGDWDVVTGAEGRHLREASTLVAAYLAWHLERGLRSLSHVQR